MAKYFPTFIFQSGSTLIRLGAQASGVPVGRRSSPIYEASSDENGFESPQLVLPITDVTAFLAGLRFEHRDKLADLPLHLAKRDLP
ncbi:MAG: hypothetical protein AMJ56_11090 [Anaerolineae bacterium SG8_19]|nr:MAG: hypothetical protein AMJ56_11090 [Anaerolineae bacterium SG8_19]